MDASDSNSSRKEYKENLSDNSDSSAYLSDSQSKKKTVTFGKNDVIQTHVEYIENMDRVQDVSGEIKQMNQNAIVEVSSSTTFPMLYFQLIFL